MIFGSCFIIGVCTDVSNMGCGVGSSQVNATYFASSGYLIKLVFFGNSVVRGIVDVFVDSRADLSFV